MEIHGLQYFGQYWFERQNDFPDVMFSIKDFHVDVLSDDTGVIRCKFHLSGTQLLPVQEPDINGTGVIPSEDPEEPPVIIIGSRPMDLFANPIDYEDGIKSRLLFNNANMDIDKGCDEVFAEYVASRKLDSDNDEEEQHDESTLAGVLPSGYEELKTFSSHLFSEKHKTINEDDVDNDSNLSSKYRKLCSINGENPNDLQPFDNEEKNSEPTHLVKLNTPASNAITMMKVGFDGIVSLHFDADSRIFLTEFYLFGAEDGEPSTPSE